MAQGSEFLVNTNTTGDQYDPSTIALNDGSFVLSWTSVAQDGGSSGIYAQSYDASGLIQGSEFLVDSSSTANTQNDVSIAAMKDGGFIVSWASDDLTVYIQSSLL